MTGKEEKKDGKQEDLSCKHQRTQSLVSAFQHTSQHKDMMTAKLAGKS